MNKSKIAYAKKDVLSEDEFSKENIKVRITTFVDLDVLKEIKKIAHAAGQKYQTLLNQKLRESILKEKSLKSDINRIKRRLEIVEQKVG